MSICITPFPFCMGWGKDSRAMWSGLAARVCFVWRRAKRPCQTPDWRLTWPLSTFKALPQQSQSTLPSAGKITVARTSSLVFSRRHSAPCRSRSVFTRYSPRPLPPVARLREPSARSVSYTHLDVYKRQKLYPAREPRLEKAVGFPVFFFHSFCILHTVSKTSDCFQTERMLSLIHI